MLIPTVDPATIGFDVPFVEYLEIAAAAGFRAVEFSIEHARSFVQAHSARDLAALTRRLNIELAQFTCGTGVPSNVSVSAGEFEQSVRRWQDNCAFAATLGCRRASVLVNSAKGNGYEEDGLTLTAGELHDRLRLLCDHASAHGITVAVEFVDAEMIALAGEIVGGAGRDNLGLLLDTYGLHKVSDPLAYVAALPQGTIVWLHLADTVVERSQPPGEYVKPLRVLPGQGNLPLGAIVEALRRQHGYRGYASVEVYGSTIMAHQPFGRRADLAAASLFEGALRSWFVSA
ncbi:MAG TPA: sugar phosphate isomerase/epimerase family protein [Herpetosiphonaceae bacterium]